MKTIVQAARKLAVAKHKGQCRKGNGHDYDEHLDDVVQLIIHEADIHDHTTLAAAWLHDVLEDTDCEEAEIEDACNAEVLSLVKASTDDKTKSLEARRADILKKLPQADIRVRIIKLADITSNVSLLPPGWSQQRIDEYIEWLDKVAALCESASPSLYQVYQRSKPSI